MRFINVKRCNTLSKRTSSPHVGEEELCLRVIRIWVSDVLDVTCVQPHVLLIVFHCKQQKMKMEGAIPNSSESIFQDAFTVDFVRRRVPHMPFSSFLILKWESTIDRISCTRKK